MLTVIWVRVMRGHFTPERHFAFEGVAWYWHFVDVVWADPVCLRLLDLTDLQPVRMDITHPPGQDQQQEQRHRQPDAPRE